MKIELVVASGCYAMMALTVGAAVALAQSRDRADPADPSAATPMAKPESAFSGYQPFREQPIRSWKDANQEVADNPGMGSMTGMPGMAGMAAGHSMPGMDPKGAAAGHDMGSMQGMPGMGSKPGASKPQAGAAGHDMSSMPGMPGMGSKPDASKPQAGAAGHDMSSMPGMPGMGSKVGAAPKAKTAAAAGHDMGSMQGMPGMGSKPGAAPKPHGADGHDHATGSMQGMPGMASSSGAAPKTGHDMGSMPNMPGMESKSGNAPSGPVTGTGVVKSVDKGTGKVRLTHEPIAAMGWPKMTLFFRLKDNSLADRVKEGDSVEFSLEKSASGYIISELRRSAASRETIPAK